MIYMIRNFMNKKNGKGFAKEFDWEGKVIYEGEYWIGEKNGKGKEYDKEDKLIFEGDYLLNHKKRGKEFVKGKLEYEGEYLYGTKFNGKGYYENGNIIYELTNGNGKVREYNNSILIFKGEYLNRERSGKGKECEIYCYLYQKVYKLLFKGEYLNGKRWNGKGKEIDSFNNLTFTGKYLNGKKWNGKLSIGSVADGELIVEELINGKATGKVRKYLYQSLIYEGEYSNGKKNGKGKEYFQEY